MKARFTFWKERDGRYLGYLNDYPGHWTQGESLEDLKVPEQVRYPICIISPGSRTAL